MKTRTNNSMDIINFTAELNGLSCPQCASNKYIKIGKEKGIQRYKCKKCNHNFRKTTGTTTHHIHKKHLIESYSQCMLKGYSLRKTAKEIGISLGTAFKWRHKLLSALSKKESAQLSKSNTVSAISIPYSEKGQKIKSQKKHAHTTSIVWTDTLNRISIKIHTSETKLSNIVTNLKLKPTYYTPDKGLPRKFKAGSTLQTTSEMHEKILTNHQELVRWIDKFRGVATKYLQHYWAWYTQMNAIDNRPPDNKILLANCLI